MYTIEELRERLVEINTECWERHEFKLELEVRFPYTDYLPYHLSVGYLTDAKDHFASESFRSYAEMIEGVEKIAQQVRTLPDADARRKQQVAKQLGQAIDAARDEGFDVEALSVSFQGIWENLLEDQRPKDYRPIADRPITREYLESIGYSPTDPNLDFTGNLRSQFSWTDSHEGFGFWEEVVDAAAAGRPHPRGEAILEKMAEVWAAESAETSEDAGE